MIYELKHQLYQDYCKELNCYRKDASTLMTPEQAEEVCEYYRILARKPITLVVG